MVKRLFLARQSLSKRVINERVSIVIPTYNSTRFIEETIDSVMRQSYVNEVLIVDDFSTDGTVDLIKQISSKHEIVKIVLKSENTGLSKNINKAVKAIKNNYFILLGHDDCLPESFVSKGLNTLLEKKGDFLFCNSKIIDENGAHQGFLLSNFKTKIKFMFVKLFLKRGNFISSCGCIQSKEKFIEVGGWDEDYKMYGEYLFWCKASKVSKFVYSTASLALYRKHENNISKEIANHQSKQQAEYNRVAKSTLTI